jgi:hypothetical protein
MQYTCDDTCRKTGSRRKGSTYVRADGEQEEGSGRFSGISEKRLVDFHSNTYGQGNSPGLNYHLGG